MYRQCNLTNWLRGIQHAWHFGYASGLVVKVVCRRNGIAWFTP
ncbi:DUF3265 domain-containing protein [Shewanella spartinae]|nr:MULTISPECIES: DUF3265 domain-containing protein [Shewanella]QYJ92777.1 DUF3265 domain-containing protein [Shewanella spartinae]